MVDKRERGIGKLRNYAFNMLGKICSRELVSKLYFCKDKKYSKFACHNNEIR